MVYLLWTLLRIASRAADRGCRMQASAQRRKLRHRYRLRSVARPPWALALPLNSPDIGTSGWQLAIECYRNFPRMRMGRSIPVLAAMLVVTVSYMREADAASAGEIPGRLSETSSMRFCRPVVSKAQFHFSKWRHIVKRRHAVITALLSSTV